MAWVRLDDQFHDHPKVVDLGPVAEALFVRGLTYAARYLTDGFVPAGVLRRMVDMDAVAEAERLVACGLWEPAAGGWTIHDYLDYQPSRQRAIEDRAANARRQGEWRERKRNATVTALRSVTGVTRNAVTVPGLEDGPRRDAAAGGDTPASGAVSGESRAQNPGDDGPPSFIGGGDRNGCPVPVPIP